LKVGKPNKKEKPLVQLEMSLCNLERTHFDLVGRRFQLEETHFFFVGRLILPILWQGELELRLGVEESRHFCRELSLVSMKG